MLKYFISILLLLFSTTVLAQQDEQEEVDVEETPPPVKTYDSLHQFRIGFDVSRLLFNQMQKDLEKRTSYEIELDYFFKKDMYWVLEGGFGNASLNYPDLSYNSNNVFLRAGINKSLLGRMQQSDWDMAFIGLRYGLGFVQRSAANYTITDSLWGSVNGAVPAIGFNAHWIEVTGGVRVEVAKNIFIGWNMRGKFMVNPNKFKELPPYNIAGYGKGEKATVFDFNVMLSYAVRWRKK